MSLDLLKQRLAALAPTKLEIQDDSAQHAGHAGNRGGGHYTILVESSQFAGKSTIMRHRLVYEAVGDLIPTQIHALSIRAYAPGEQP
ncbi:BolA protein [Novimethylophilus kurashikiensis]|uniref:BolA protein n=1 Tax=Novimethylophilus kurashikiensis TaxID=1825523 RepID=A0A2R5F2I1_9PROT|nr:BolA family protein [Novimethylophilus kurashikiensis]GBG12635.1 BolA protein [Novimethylophilus kurashikiensis]